MLTQTEMLDFEDLCFILNNLMGFGNVGMCVLQLSECKQLYERYMALNTKSSWSVSYSPNSELI